MGGPLLKMASSTTVMCNGRGSGSKMLMAPSAKVYRAEKGKGGKPLPLTGLEQRDITGTSWQVHENSRTFSGKSHHHSPQVHD